jgi:hypothetical protein
LAGPAYVVINPAKGFFVEGREVLYLLPLA